MKLHSDGIRANGPENHEPEVKSPEQVATVSQNKHESRFWRIFKLTRWAVPISGVVLAIFAIEDLHFKDLLSHQEGLVGLLHEIGIHDIDTQAVTDNADQLLLNIDPPHAPFAPNVLEHAWHDIDPSAGDIPQEYEDTIAAKSGFVDARVEPPIGYQLKVDEHDIPRFIRVPVADVPDDAPTLTKGADGPKWVPGREEQEPVVASGNPTAEVKPAPQEAPKVEKPAATVAPHTTNTAHHTPQVPHTEVVRPTEDAYLTARNNLGGVTTADGVHHGGIATEIVGLTDPTEAQVTAAQQAIATKLGVNPWEVPPDTAREALLNGGFSDSGHSYELWQDNSGDTIRLVEHPTDDLNQLPETHTPDMEISDVVKDQLITGTAVLHDPTIHDFAGENGYEPGSPEYAAWNNIHLFLKDHESVYGTSWEQSTEKLSDYLNRIGVYKE